jgi:hypothetical protein
MLLHSYVGGQDWFDFLELLVRAPEKFIQFIFCSTSNPGSNDEVLSRSGEEKQQHFGAGNPSTFSFGFHTLRFSEIMSEIMSRFGSTGG